MSENDESNIEAPSPVTPIKSPDKSQDRPTTPIKKDSSLSEVPLLLSNTEGTMTPPSPATPPSVLELPPTIAVANSPGVPSIDAQTGKPQAVVKPAILRFGLAQPTEEYSSTTSTVFGHNGKSQVTGKSLTKNKFYIKMLICNI